MVTLFIDSSSVVISCKSNVLVVTSKNCGKRQTFPINRISKIVLRSPANIEASVLSKLWEIGAGFLVLSGRGNMPTARMGGQPYTDVARRLAQYEMINNSEKITTFGKWIVKNKLNNQIKTLNRLSDIRHKILKYTKTINKCIEDLNTASNINEIRGYEGAAAAAYWEDYMRFFPKSLEFKSRNRRPPKDPVNALLSLSYTLIANEALCQCQLFGLDPMMAALHSPARGRTSLAFDLIEPFRPQIDYFVWELFHKRIIRPEHFSISSDKCILGKAGRLKFYESWEELSKLSERWLRLTCREWCRKLQPNNDIEEFEYISVKE